MKKSMQTVKIATTLIILLFTIHTNGQHINTLQFGSILAARSCLNFMQKVPDLHISGKLKETNQGKKTMMQRLDSISVEGYDSVSHLWTLGERKFYVYDVNGNCILTTSLNWNDSTKKLENEFKHVFTYNSGGRPNSEQAFIWDKSTKKWLAAYQFEYNFDDKGNQTLSNEYYWNDTSSEWKASGKNKSTYTYNIADKIILKIDSSWTATDNLWTPKNKIEYAYNAMGSDTLTVYNLWDSSTHNWEISGKHEKMYDLNGNLIFDIHSRWNLSALIWIVSNKEEHSYDIKNNETIIIYSGWNYSISNWLNFSKTENSYDVGGNLTLKINYNWNTTTNQWENRDLAEYTFNNSYTSNDIIQPYFLNDLHKHMLTNYTRKLFAGNSWLNVFKVNFHYSSFSFTGIDENELLEKINIYPNPTSGLITVTSTLSTITNITVYDLMGKCVYTEYYEQIQNPIQLDLSFLNNGIYFINVQDENGQLNKNKIILAK